MYKKANLKQHADCGVRILSVMHGNKSESDFTAFLYATVELEKVCIQNALVSSSPQHCSSCFTSCGVLPKERSRMPDYR